MHIIELSVMLKGFDVMPHACCHILLSEMCSLERVQKGSLKHLVFFRKTRNKSKGIGSC